MNNRSFSPRSITKIALCVALFCVTAYLSFPLPFTLSMVSALTLSMGLAAFVLTPKETFVAIGVYILIGLAGVPVFTGGTAGPGKLFGPTGGFILIWLLTYPLVSALKGAEPSFRRYAAVDIVVGMPLTYVGGLASLMFWMDVTIWQAVMMAVVPFIPGDILKCLGAAALGVRINKSMVQI